MDMNQDNAADQAEINDQVADQTPAAESQEVADDLQAVGGEQESQESPKGKMEALLDSLTDGADKKPEQEANQDGSQAQGSGESEEAKAKQAEAAAAANPEDEATGDKEETELLAGIKSERGRERIKKVFEERRALQQDLESFRNVVQSTGMSAEDFAQSLEYGRLVNAGDESSLRVALQMIENQRSAICQRLGIEAPGVDMLEGFDDLKSAVGNYEITRDRAVEIAKFRKQEAQARASMQAQQQMEQDRAGFAAKVQSAGQAMEAYLNTRANEIDHPARWKAIREHFSDPAKLQAFVSTYTPDQWVPTLRMMYDNISVPRQAPAVQPQPIRSRPASLGTPAASATQPIDRIAQRLESMGL